MLLDVVVKEDHLMVFCFLQEREKNNNQALFEVVGWVCG